MSVPSAGSHTPDRLGLPVIDRGNNRFTVRHGGSKHSAEYLELALRQVVASGGSKALARRSIDHGEHVAVLMLEILQHGSSSRAGARQ